MFISFRALSLCIGGGLLAAAAIPIYFAWRWVRPHREPWPRDIKAQQVFFPSLDGHQLQGLWLGDKPNRPTVILCHGYFRSLAEPYEIGLWLNGEGYNALLFDFRGCGRSEAAFTTLAAKETLDVLGAIRWAKEHTGGPIALYGISMGASAALMAAARSPDVAVLLLDSPYSELEAVVEQRLVTLISHPWLRPVARLSVRLGEILSANAVCQVRPIDAVGGVLPRPMLFIFGENDSLIPRWQWQDLYQASGAAGELWVAPGSGHVRARFDHPEEYRRRLSQFLKRHLGAPAPVEEASA